MGKYIYIVYGISLEHLTEAQIDKRYKKWKIDNPKRTKNDFLWYYTDLKKENPDISIERVPFAYFTDEENALNFTKSNRADFNEGGAYNFALIEGLLLGVAYPETEIDKKYYIFEYSNQNKCYTSIKDKDSEEAIRKKYCENCFY